MFYRDTWAEIDLDRIFHNVSQIKAHSGLEYLFAVVKANAYGHGDVEVARTALEAGATHLAVALLDEAIHLRRAFEQTPILVMGPIRVEDIGVAAKLNIAITAHDLDWVEAAAGYQGEKEAEGESAPVDIHIKLDTGMNRIGMRQQHQFAEACRLLRSNSAFNLCGLFTHFATADGDETIYQQQLENFDRLTRDTDLGQFELIHQSNSAAMLRHARQSCCNAGRLGIAMYGLPPSDDLQLPFELQQAFSLHTRITQVKAITTGDKVGYGATYQADCDQHVATLPVGYADGWLRYHQDREIEISGKRFPLIGRICMDQSMIRVDANITAGTQVTLLGDLITVTDAANDLNTINYEITCSISERVPRLYKRHGEMISQRNDRFQL
ncbi:MAG: alanine racemase [Motiliproteus sp.]